MTDFIGLKPLTNAQYHQHITSSLRIQSGGFVTTCELHTGIIQPSQTYPIIINPLGDDVKVVDAIFSLYPEWAKQPISYASHLASFDDIKNNRTFKKPFKKSQFCLVPVEAVLLSKYYNQDTTITKSIETNLSSLSDNIILKSENGVLWVAGIYEHNISFEPETHSFAILTSSKHLLTTESLIKNNDCMNHRGSINQIDTIPLLVDPLQADRYLVSNWKYVARYLQFDILDRFQV